MNHTHAFEFSSRFVNSYINGWGRRYVRIGPLHLIFGRRYMSRIPLRVWFGARKLL